DGCFHVTTRGVDGCPIYRDDDDRLAFLTMLALCVRRHGWTVHAYCLMSNHYHLIVETAVPQLSAGMELLNGEHAAAFNQKHGRKGHPFGGRFHSWMIEDEEHLANATAYVLTNPIRAGICTTIDDYRWSASRHHLLQKEEEVRLPGGSNRSERPTDAPVPSSHEHQHTHLTVRRRDGGTDEEVRRPDGRRQRRAPHPERLGLRLPRPERRRQDDPDPRAARAHPRHRRHDQAPRTGCPGTSRRGTQPHRRHRRGAALPRAPDGTREPEDHRRGPGLRGLHADRRVARPRGAGEPRRRPRRHLLAGDAAAPRHRPLPARRPRAARRRRAAERSRPGGDRGIPRPDRQL